MDDASVTYNNCAWQSCDSSPQEVTIEDSGNHTDPTCQFETDPPREPSSLSGQVFLSVVYLCSVPRSAIQVVDRIVKTTLGVVGLTSRRLCKGVIIIIRCTILLVYCSLIWLIPVACTLIGSTIIVTWLSMFLFYFIYSVYVPSLAVVNIPVNLVHPPFRSTEVWMLPDRCHTAGCGRMDSIRYVPQPLPSMKQIPKHQFLEAELVCGVSSSVLPSFDALLGSVPFPACGDKCDLTGMLRWNADVTERSELANVYIDRKVMASHFKSQYVDLGIDFTYDPEIYNSRMFENGGYPEIEWTVVASYQKIEPRFTTIDSEVLTRRKLTPLYRPSLFVRMLQWIVDTCTTSSMSKHDLYRQLSTQVRELFIFNVSASSDITERLNDSKLCLSDIEYITVQLTPPIRINVRIAYDDDDDDDTLLNLDPGSCHQTPIKWESYVSGELHNDFLCRFLALNDLLAGDAHFHHCHVYLFCDTSQAG
eukprot:GHVH01014584.1.p1 GENE.GHVH01014584.1~~GHVH01014584.1.p1  ORF type:complete len:500 (+),score=46.03 GHVH01014584.1:70-1500(+)